MQEALDGLNLKQLENRLIEQKQLISKMAWNQHYLLQAIDKRVQENHEETKRILQQQFPVPKKVQAAITDLDDRKKLVKASLLSILMTFGVFIALWLIGGTIVLAYDRFYPQPPQPPLHQNHR